MAVHARSFDRRPAGWQAAGVALALLLLAGTAVALVGSGGRSSGDEASSVADSSSGLDAAYGQEAATTTPGFAEEDAAGGGATTEDAGSVASVVPATAGQARIIRTASLDVRVRGDVLAAVDRAEAVAVAAGGFVSSSTTSAGDGERARGELTLRVPADRFDEVRRRLGDLGRVRAAETGGEDVGGQLVDLGARLRALRAEEGALETLLGRSGDVGSILQVRDRLASVRTSIEQLAAHEASLQDRVAFATIHLSIARAGTPAAATGGDGEGLGESWRTAVDAAEAVLGGMIVVVGAVLPFGVLALLAGGVWLLVRRRRPAAALEHS